MSPRGKSTLLSAYLFSLLCSNAINLSRCSHGHFDITPSFVSHRGLVIQSIVISLAPPFVFSPLLFFSFHFSLQPCSQPLLITLSLYKPGWAVTGGRRQGVLGGGDLRLKVGANPVSPAATATNRPYPAVFGSHLVTRVHLHGVLLGGTGEARRLFDAAPRHL